MPSGSRPAPGPLSHHVAAVLTRQIASRGLRRLDIAAAAGMSPSQLSRTLSATKVFTLDQLDAVCRAVGVPLVEVVTLPDQAPVGAADVIVGDFDVARRAQNGRAVAKGKSPDRGEGMDHDG